MNKNIFLPISKVAELNNINKNHLKSLSYKEYEGNDFRFKKIGGVLYVLENYKYPYAQELDTLRQKALIIAHTEYSLCVELSKISDLKVATLQKYFYRFTFKRAGQAKKVIQLLKTYIKKNSLFSEELLEY